jgi:hypothetical protein
MGFAVFAEQRNFPTCWRVKKNKEFGSNIEPARLAQAERMTQISLCAVMLSTGEYLLSLAPGSGAV